MNDRPFTLIEKTGAGRGNLDRQTNHPENTLDELADRALSRCWAEIDISAFKRNVRRMQEFIEGRTGILLPVKADAYGHGTVEISKAALEEGISCFGVSSLDEALAIRNAGIDAKVVFLTPPLPDQLPSFLENNVTPVLTSSDTALRLGALARAQSKVAVVHVEVDTGMGRTGIDWRNAADEIRKIAGLDGLKLEGLMTHFACADDLSSTYTQIQIERFRKVLSEMPYDLSNELLIHTSNSAATLRFRDTHHTMIRPGLFLYGVSPLHRKQGGIEAPEPVLSLRSRVILVKRVPRGEPISYGGRWTTEEDTDIATISAGYRDGVDYSLSDGGQVLIRGKRYPIVGSVCMDMIMTNLGTGTGIVQGDVVTIIGRDGEESIDVREVARASGTIPYDCLCSTGMRVPRVYRSDDRIVKVLPSMERS